MARARKEEAKRIGAQIAKLRDERTPYTQEAAAAKMKVAIRTYQSWELGEAVPRWHNREKLAKLFKVKVEDITGRMPGGPATDLDRLERIEARVEEIAARVEEISALLKAETPAPPGVVAGVVAPLAGKSGSPPPPAPDEHSTRPAASRRKSA